MSLIDLTLAGVMALAILKSVQASLSHRQLRLTKNIVAFIVALLLHQHAAYLLGATSLPARMESFVDVVITLPAGPGTEVARGLMWLREADLPEAIAQAIREAWLRDISADVRVMTLAARRVVAKAVLNLACFVVLFMVVRWLLNLTSIHVVKALPPSIARGNRALGLLLGLAQSIVVCAILVAIVAPLVVTGLLPPLLVEHLRHSRLADVLLSILHYLNIYRL
ncbi:MAG: hypothetical protein DDT37_01491 [Firmicutes bacterium]|nr:hypothetical protein [candidate division NPL-UPA2 bacterium]